MPAAKYGVKVLTANTNNDQAKEAELIQTYISQGVNGIAIAPLSKDASIANLKQADAKGIKVAITNMSITDTSFLVGGFTSDDATNAKIVGDNAAKFIKANLELAPSTLPASTSTTSSPTSPKPAGTDSTPASRPPASITRKLPTKLPTLRTLPWPPPPIC